MMRRTHAVATARRFWTNRREHRLYETGAVPVQAGVSASLMPVVDNTARKPEWAGGSTGLESGAAQAVDLSEEIRKKVIAETRFILESTEIIEKYEMPPDL